MDVRRLAGGAAALALVAGPATACGSDRPEQPSAVADDATTPPAVTPEAAGFGGKPEPTTATAPTTAPEPSPSTAPTTQPPRFEGECIGSREGDPAAKGQVAAALADAADRTYWPISAPELTVSADLVKAVAWQESGWQSNIVACDGGIGVMQVMPDTVEFIHQRFEVSYDPHTLDGNTTLGANYLAWLVKYFGDVHFDGAYQATAADCAGPTDTCLLNVVAAAYNVGFGAVEEGGLQIPNPQYVSNIRALMTQCECHAY